jgi:tripartite-type tricarboxylate transporter receptor subunit TctC
LRIHPWVNLRQDHLPEAHAVSVIQFPFASLCVPCVPRSSRLWPARWHCAGGQLSSKPIRIIVPYPPGGFNDTLARTLGQKFNEKWGQPVVVDNRPGGGTTIGTSLVAKAPADGHTLLIVSFAFGVNPSLYARLPYDTQRDFAPVVLAAGTPNVLVVKPQLPVKSVMDLIAGQNRSPENSTTRRRAMVRPTTCRWKCS